MRRPWQSSSVQTAIRSEAVTFPVTERVVYQKNTIEGVKCEIRFPPILAIETDLPARFQEQVRIWFPFYEQKTAVLPPGVPPVIAQAVSRDMAAIGGKTYVFTSEDRSAVLSLTKECISLTSSRYDRWEPFQERVTQALNALASVYTPGFFTHTCIRYRNSIRRSELGLENVPWSRLVKPWISGPCAMPETADLVEAIQSRCIISLPNGDGKVEANIGTGLHQITRESVFIIESHVFHDARKESQDVPGRLDTLHQHAGRFFNWCITDELRMAMRPCGVAMRPRDTGS